MKKKTTPRRRRADPFKQMLAEMLTTSTHEVRVMTYAQARDMSASFIETIYHTIAEESTDLEMEMVKTAGKEILDLLKQKYEMEPANACSMLLLMGMGMLQELDRQLDERRERG